ncbi:hypothetical protein KJ918_06145 [Patescibacteria group bacterium]|nr:hypothetical protein [Patescibacteria group bacterium]
MSKKQQGKGAIIKKMSVDEVKEVISTSTHIDSDPRELYKKLGERIPEIREEGETPDENDELLIKRAVYIDNFDNSSMLVETVGQNYRPFITNFVNTLIDEYECVTPSEKALTQIAASAYVRMIMASKKLNDAHYYEYLSHERNGYLASLSKEVDRASRQFVHTVQTLKQLKSPPLKINVKTKAAYIAQNQQLIDNRGKTDETIKH